MNQRDLELLSSYLDHQLNPSDSARLEARLKSDPQLISALNDLRATRSLLRKLPQRRAPRNFTLTRQMVGQNPPLPRAYPFLRFATAFATLLFVFSFGLNSLGRQFAAQASYGIGGGGGNAGEATIESYSAAPAATQPPAALAAPTLQAPLAPLPTPTVPEVSNQTRTLETPASKGAADSFASGQRQTVQTPAPLVSSLWQIVLAGIAVLSAILMLLMRRSAISRWRK